MNILESTRSGSFGRHAPKHRHSICKYLYSVKYAVTAKGKLSPGVLIQQLELRGIVSLHLPGFHAHQMRLPRLISSHPVAASPLTRVAPSTPGNKRDCIIMLPMSAFQRILTNEERAMAEERRGRQETNRSRRSRRSRITLQHHN